MNNLITALRRVVHSGISPIVYHYTAIPQAVAILKDNQFKLSTALGGEGRFRSPKDTKKGRFYFLSTTRQKSPKSFGGQNRDVNFVLDGKALAANHSGTPMEFYGNDIDIKEAEDRVWSKDPYIKNADKYITEVHVHEGKGTGALVAEAEKLGIPIFVYDDRAAWKTTNKKKAKPYEGGDDSEVHKPHKNEFSQLSNFIAYYEEDDIGSLNDEQRQDLRDLFGRDGWERLTGGAKNVAKDPMAPKLIKIMQKNRWETLRQFYDHLADKWREAWDEWRLGT